MSSISRIIEWYWQFAPSKESRYALRATGWLDRLYETARIERQILLGESCKKPTMAIWGPSQSGKSTLISNYVDSGADDIGCNSALHWSKNHPARFTKTKDIDAVILNPHNFGSDASGCVSRFCLKESVEDPEHPVQIKLAKPIQIAHALAMGYLSECLVRDQRGDERLLTVDLLAEIVATHTTGRPRSELTPHRNSYELLHEFSNLLDILVHSEVPRYRNLKRHPSQVRSVLLDAAHVLTEHASVNELMADILWDGHKPLTSLYSKLEQTARDCAEQWGNFPIYCSMSVASVLLDIDSYKKICGEHSRSRIAELVTSWRCRKIADRITIGNEGSEFLPPSDTECFGLFQGLVLELVIPLREDILRKESSVFCEFLQSGDLLDFPGVALAHENMEQTRINLQDLRAEQEPKLYTEVLKRGKTASIVTSYARDLTIDGFSVLNRIKNFPAHPDQLWTGIQSWWKAHDPSYEIGELRPCPLPLNLVLTFCAELIRPVVQGGVREGLSPVFQRLRKLGLLSDPNVISHTLSTNYPQFLECELPEEEAVNLATAAIMKDPSFQKQFSTDSGRECFQEMTKNGGTDHIFEVFRRQMNTSNRSTLLTKRKQAHRFSIEALVSEAVPTASDDSQQRIRMAEKCRSHIRQLLEDAQSEEDFMKLGFAIRRFLHVPLDCLDPLPLQAKKDRVNEVSSFVSKQIARWTDERTRTPIADVEQFGLNDPAELSSLVYLLADGVAVQPIAVWMRRYLGGLASRDEAKRARYFLSIRINNDLLRPPNDYRDPHVNPEEVVGRLGEYARAEAEFDFKASTSPHYHQSIEPFLLRLETLATQRLPGTRPPQPGDVELIAVAESILASFVA